MATYSLSNFAAISGTLIMIYDATGVLRYSIIPSESQFYSSRYNCIIDVHGNGNDADRYRILDFPSEADAESARVELESLKSLVQYYVEWENISDTPTTIEGYGITDAYTSSQVDALITGVTIVFTDYYTSAQTTANFLSANTSYYTQEQNNVNFLSASTSYYTQEQVNIIVLSAISYILSITGQTL